MLKNSDPALYESFLAARSRHQHGDLAGAEAIYSRLLAMDPADDELLFLFGHLKASQGETEVGLECLRMAAQLKPGNQQIPFAIGLVLQEAGRSAESVLPYRQAVALDPGYRDAWENLCAACYDMGDFLAGLVAAEKALDLDPESPLAIRGAANCLTALGRRPEALALLDAGVGFHPALPDLRIHRAWELMANDQYQDGWLELEWRHASVGERRDAPPRSVPYPRWNGEDLEGKTILVYGEQGIGDEVMYAPFVLGLIKAGAKCIFECDRRLERLFARAFPESLILRREQREQIPWHASLPVVDYCVPALSLPLYFSHPLAGRPFLVAEPERKDYWRARLDVLGPGLKVGVSWRGGVDAKVRKIRSIPEHIFGELINESSVFVSLQYGATADEVSQMSENLTYFPEIDPLTDIDEFVALLSALDVVISIDNSTVHFAGALGVKTLLLLPVYSEWRWGAAVSGVSSWYQSLSFIRQAEASEQGWRDLLGEARNWLSGCDPAEQSIDETLTSADKTDQITAAVTIDASVSPGRSAVLIGDSNCWGTWGATCSSLGLHEGLRERFDTITVVPMARLQSNCPTDFAPDCLDSDEFFSRFVRSFPDVLSAIQSADYVVINGQEVMHGETPLSLFLLYLAYIAKSRLGKPAAIVNHACTPGDSPTSNRFGEYYAKVYRSLDMAVVRDSSSLSRVSAFGGHVALGFDCLAHFLARRSVMRAPAGAGELVFSRSEVSDGCFELAQWAIAQNVPVAIVSGAKAFLAVEQIAFVEQLVRGFDARNIPHELHFPVSEMEWLQRLGKACLLVSGQFHDLLAAASLGVSSVVPQANACVIDMLLPLIGGDNGRSTIRSVQADSLLDKGQTLLGGSVVFPANDGQLEILRGLARVNVLALASSDELAGVVAKAADEAQPSKRQNELIVLYSQMAERGYETVDGQHVDVAFSDMEIRAFKDVVRPLFEQFSIKSLLDYGCGGSNYDFPGFDDRGASAKHFFGLYEVYLYEPARCIDQRRVSDAVVCFDVLEHVFVADVPRVVREIFSLTGRLLVVNVACYMARATLPNGENAHITVRPPLWWKGVFDSIAVEFPDVTVQLWCSTGWRNVEGYALMSARQWHESETFAVLL